MSGKKCAGHCVGSRARLYRGVAPLFRHRALLFAAFLALPNLAHAAWPLDGLLLSGPDGEGARIVPDGQGGAFVAWTDSRSGVQNEIYGTRVSSNGALAPGWPPQDTPICTALGSAVSLSSAA